MQPLTATDPHRIADFELMNRIGVGGMGVVYLGRRQSDGRLAAVKMIREELGSDRATRARFQHETTAAQKVHSPRVAAVLAAGFEGEHAYLAVDFVQGPTLTEAIAKDGPLTGRGLADLSNGLAEALVAIHKAGLIHRDLTPRNVLLTHAGPCVIDFGIARLNDATILTATGDTIGTAGYVAPERLLRSESLPAGDVFSVGALIALAATGRPPYGIGTAMEIHFRVVNSPPDISGVPAALHPIVQACLASDPAARPTAQQLRDRLAVAQSAMATAPGPGPTMLFSPVHGSAAPVPGAPAPRRTGRLLAILAAAVVVVAAIVGGVFVLNNANATNDSKAGVTKPSAGAKASPTVSPTPDPVPSTPDPTTPPPSTAPPTTTAPPAPAKLPAGTFHIDQTFYDDNRVKLELTTMQVKSDGSITATVVYTNETIIPFQLDCVDAQDPTIDTLTRPDGLSVEATKTYCSDSPNSNPTLQPGDSSTSYAIFNGVTGATGPFTLQWQSGDPLTGTVGNINLTHQ